MYKYMLREGEKGFCGRLGDAYCFLNAGGDGDKGNNAKGGKVDGGYVYQDQYNTSLELHPATMCLVTQRLELP